MDRALLTARWLVCTPEEARAGGGLLLVDGRVAEVLAGPAAVHRCATREGLAPEDLGECALTPGLVDAHAHLELSGLAGRVSGEGSFPEWIGRLVPLRRELDPASLEEAARAGADELLRTGTTTVGDVDSSGASARALASHPIRARVYREALDLGDPERRAAILEVLAHPLPPATRLSEGLSPHAPYTVGDELLRALGELARQRSLPSSVHWNETEEEREWLERGTGPFAALLPGGPRGPGLERLAACGFLPPAPRPGALSLVHGNVATDEEIERVARSGAALVHCPGTHRFFARPPFELERYRRAGVPLALGTDSLASNEALDMRREMALLRAAQPSLPPAEVWDMATRGAARALDLGGRVGELRAEAFADVCAWRGSWADARALLEELTSVAGPPERVWVGGRRPGESG